MRHLEGFKDWLTHPVMSTFCLQWAHSLADVAAVKKTNTGRVDPFSDEVLGFARKDEVALKCAKQLNLFGEGTKLGDKANDGRGSGRFREAYDNFKKTTGQVRPSREGQVGLGGWRIGSHVGVLVSRRDPLWPLCCQVLYDFIDEREITMGTFRGDFDWVTATLIYGATLRSRAMGKGCGGTD